MLNEFDRTHKMDIHGKFHTFLTGMGRKMLGLPVKGKKPTTLRAEYDEALKSDDLNDGKLVDLSYYI